MCGILGLVGQHPPDKAKIHKAMQLIANRGPDHQDNLKINDQAWFGHTRLSIIDLSAAGHQPFQFENLTLGFNGIIYNHKTLRQDLEAKGYDFHSTSDTEVLIKAWHCWGVDALPKLDGFFAFALYDKKDQKLYLCRDSLGKKPLYWRYWNQGSENQGIAFASRLDAVEAITAKEPLNKDAIPWLFYLRYIPSPMTAVQNIFKLDRGHYLVHTNTNTEIHKWSKTYGIDRDGIKPHHTSPKSLKENIISAVQKRLEADVPVTCLLSGGLDSTIITTLAARFIKMDSFTLAITSQKNDLLFNEADIAAKTAAALGTNHHTITLTEDDALASMEVLFKRVFDEPFADPASILNHLIFSQVSKQSKVCLTGDGGDELFGGYRRHQGYLMAHHPLANNPLTRTLAKVIAPLLPDRRDHAFLEKLRLLRRYLTALNQNTQDGHSTQDGRSWLCRHDIVPHLFIIESDHAKRFSEWPHEATPGMDVINAFLSLEMQWTIPGQMMVKTDRTSMDVGVEVRSPFLDRDVVCSAFALPGPSKLKRNQGKAILRDLFGQEIPSHVLSEPKRSFDIPLQAWLKGPFDSYMRGVADDEFLHQIGLKPQTVANWIEILKRSNSFSVAEYLWALIGLKSWYDAR